MLECKDYEGQDVINPIVQALDYICLSVSRSVCLSHCLTVCVLQVKDVNQIALEITTMAWEKKGLRDELFIQLCRQTSSNSNP